MRRLGFIVILAGLVAGGPALAQPGQAVAETGSAIGSVCQLQVPAGFSIEAQAIIRSYFQQNPMAPDVLPPGMRNRLAKGKPLPPGIAKKALPQPLLSRLPPWEGYQPYIIGPDVYLIETTTNLIVDILTGVLG